MVLGLTVKFLISFYFLYGVRKLSSFILLDVAVQLPPTPFIEETISFPLYILASFFIG